MEEKATVHMKLVGVLALAEDFRTLTFYNLH